MSDYSQYEMPSDHLEFASDELSRQLNEAYVGYVMRCANQSVPPLEYPPNDLETLERQSQVWEEVENLLVKDEVSPKPFARGYLAAISGGISSHIERDRIVECLTYVAESDCACDYEEGSCVVCHANELLKEAFGIDVHGNPVEKLTPLPVGKEVADD